MTIQDVKSKSDSFLAGLLGPFTGIIVVAGIVAPALEPHAERSIGIRILWSAGFCWAVIAEIWFLWAIWRTILDKDQSVGTTVAMRQPRLPRALRPVAALWWLFRFIFSFAMFIAFAVVTDGSSFGGFLLLYGLTWGFAYLTYGFLLLAVTAFEYKPQTIDRIWRFREIWATLLAGVTLVIHITGPHRFR